MGRMFSLDDKELRQMEKDLKTFGKRAYPFATRQTIHLASKRGRELAIRQVSRTMTLRNKFTTQSIQFAPSGANKITLNVGRQAAFVGATEEYLAKQEFGGTEQATGRHGVAIPTAWSAGQEGQKPRTKLPRRPNAIQNIQLQRRMKRAKTRAQKNVIAAQTAVQTGNRYVFMDFGQRSKGIYRIIGGSKRVKSGWPGNARAKMVYNLDRRSIRIPRNNWLFMSTQATQKEIPVFYRSSLLFQLKRHGIGHWR